MINLLPDETKRDIRAARFNIVLLRYNLMAVVAVIILAVFCLMFYLILRNNQSIALSTTNDNSVRASHFTSVRQATDEYKNNLTIASKILDNGISYTDVIIAMTKLIPSGVVLDGINLSATEFGQQSTFAAHAKSYAAAAVLKENFEKSSLFSNVYFQTLSVASPNDPTNKIYPVAITMSAKMGQVGKL